MLASDLTTPAVAPARLDPAALCLAAGVSWNFLGLTAGFFDDVWGSAPIPIEAMSYALNAGIVLWLPLRDTSRFVPKTQHVAWVLAAWSAIGVVATPLLGPARYSLLPLSAAVIATPAALLAHRQR